MYECINGWTKKKMLKILNARRYSKPAIDKTTGSCLYLAANGNKCAVGLFIPKGHAGQKFSGIAYDLFTHYEDLSARMPLSQIGMTEFQESHDSETYNDGQKFNGNAKEAMIAWVKKNVED